MSEKRVAITCDMCGLLEIESDTTLDLMIDKLEAEGWKIDAVEFRFFCGSECQGEYVCGCVHAK